MFNFLKYCLVRIGLYVPRRRIATSAQLADDSSFIKVSELHNGLRVVTDNTQSFMSALAIYIQAGPRHENHCNNGISHVISHLILKGTRFLPKSEIEQFCLNKQVRFDTHTYRDMLAMRAFYIDPSLTIEILNMFAKIVKEFQLNKKMFEEEMFNLCVEAVDYEYNPRKVVFDYLHQAAFQCTSMGQNIIGSTNNFQKIDSKMVSDFITRQFQPNNMVISACGSLAHDDILSAAASAFSEESLDCKPSWYGKRFVASDIRYRDDSMPYVHVAVAFEAPCYGHDDYLAMLIAKNMFGSWHRDQGGGMLNRDLPAQAGAVDDMCVCYKSFYLAYSDVGLWGFYFVSDMLAADDMIINLQNFMNRLIIMSTKNDIRYGMVLVRRDLHRRRSNVYKRVHDNAVQVMYTGQVKVVADYAKEFCMLDKPNFLVDKIDNYLYDRNPVSAAVGPTENVTDMVRMSASTWWLRF